jgi:hypothetical protein
MKVVLTVRPQYGTVATEPLLYVTSVPFVTAGVERRMPKKIRVEIPSRFGCIAMIGLSMCGVTDWRERQRSLRPKMIRSTFV